MAFASVTLLMKRKQFWRCAASILAAASTLGAAESVVQFRTPQPVVYRIEQESAERSALARSEWLRAWTQDGTSNRVEFGSRVVLQTRRPEDLRSVLADSTATLARTINSNTFILQAADARDAIAEAARLSRRSGVRACYPVMRREGGLHGGYAPYPSDFYFGAQWPLEHRDGDGTIVGPSVNARGAWAYTRGGGVTVAVADTGVELNHQELQAATARGEHRNFFFGSTNGMPINRSALGGHGTHVAGIIAAGLNNHRITGAAPEVALSSWVVFSPFGSRPSDEQLFDMYQYTNGNVSVQNHSWGAGNGSRQQAGPTLLESMGIDLAATEGRAGRGAVMVRSGGNDRGIQSRADDDAYLATPHAIGVAAVNVTGRAALYSEPGACLLVSGPSGDSSSSAHGLFTTDLLGADGANSFGFFPPNVDLSDYLFYNQFTGIEGFNGTSAAAPHISAVAALILSVNPSLTLRDVQQILLLSARQFDPNDPDLVINSAGLAVSHNTGYGVPDAGDAVQLALAWSNRPPVATTTIESTNEMVVPDDGLRVEVQADGLPEALLIRCLPGTGIHADDPTPELELVDIGLATNVPALNLTNKAALILRGGNSFADKIENAAGAGATFAIVYNYSTNVDPVIGGDFLTAMGQTDFVSIPAVFIGNTDGEMLKALFATNTSARARIRLHSAEATFAITNQLVCEHVGLHVQTTHTNRGQMRITLVSPSGTRSVLQAYNGDTSTGADWTYWSTHHFFEGSSGEWRVYVTDEVDGGTGTVTGLSLIVRGVAILDSDGDGLDDAWELAHFEALQWGGADDPDADGAVNSREQVMQTDPAAAEIAFAVDLSWWSNGGARRARLAWPGAPQNVYQVFGGTNLASLEWIADVPGRFPETEWIAPARPVDENWFYRVYATRP